jgi:hypothetical protein
MSTRVESIKYRGSSSQHAAWGKHQTSISKTPAGWLRRALLMQQLNCKSIHSLYSLTGSGKADGS